MTYDRMRLAIEAARPGDLPDLSRELWASYGAGRIDDVQAEALGILIQARTPATAPSRRPRPARVHTGARPRTPESLQRRRRWAAAGWMPPAIAARFTLGEQAVLAVIAAEASKGKDCRLPIGLIAAMAGVGRSTVKRALQAAKEIIGALIEVRERRLSRWRSDTNIVRIVSREWLSWLRTRARAQTARGGGVQQAASTNTEVNQSRNEACLKPPRPSDGREPDGRTRPETGEAS